jgi:hypothetical protein
LRRLFGISIDFEKEWRANAGTAVFRFAFPVWSIPQTGAGRLFPVSISFVDQPDHYKIVMLRKKKDFRRPPENGGTKN